MADFYRRTRIEELEEKYPGTVEFTEKAARRGIPDTDVAAAILERTGESISSQAVGVHRISRIWKKDNLDEQAVREKYAMAIVHLKLAIEHPELDDAKIAKVFLNEALLENEWKLADADPLKIMAERRRHVELEQRQQEIEIERERLAHEKRELELKVAQLERARAVERNEVMTAVTEVKDPNELRKKIFELYGVYQQADPAALPGQVG